MKTIDLGTFTLEEAKGLEGTVFETSLPDGTRLALTLERIAAYDFRGRRPKSLKRDSFSIYFAGPPEPILAQGMYTLRGKDAVIESIFIVPVGRDGGRTEYEAVFT